MSELLEMAHLSDEYGVTEMEIGCGRIESGLDPQAGSPWQRLARASLPVPPAE
jgi:hypothetical protein